MGPRTLEVTIRLGTLGKGVLFAGWPEGGGNCGLGPSPPGLERSVAVAPRSLGPKPFGKNLFPGGGIAAYIRRSLLKTSQWVDPAIRERAPTEHQIELFFTIKIHHVFGNSFKILASFYKTKRKILEKLLFSRPTKF